MLHYLDGYRLIRNSVLEDVNVNGVFELNQKLLNCTSWLEIANGYSLTDVLDAFKFLHFAIHQQE